MSRIGKQAVPIPSGVDVKVDGRKATVKGPKGLLSRDLPMGIEVQISSDSIQVLPPSRPKEKTSVWIFCSQIGTICILIPS